VTDFSLERSLLTSRKLSMLMILSLVTIPAIQAQAVQAQAIQSDRLEIAQADKTSYPTVFVNPQTGSNTNNGSDNAPFKTLTHALSVVNPNSIIKLAPGSYTSNSGEIFPIQLKSSVTVQGEPSDRGQHVLIQGSGLFLSKTSAGQQITVLGADRAGLLGVTVSNPDPQGYGLWIESSSPVVSDSTFTSNGHDGVSIVGNSAPILKNNYFYNNGANGITIYGTSRPEIRDSIFEKTGFGINITQNAAPRIIGNRITGNKDGIVVQGNATPIFRSNVIDGNDRDGLVAITTSRPDLGTQSDQGNNTFMNNGGLDINAKSNSQVIPTAGNQYSKTSGRLDVNAIEAVAQSPIQPAPIQQSTQLIRSVPPVQTAFVPVAAIPVSSPIALNVIPVVNTPVVKSLPPAVTMPVSLASPTSPSASPTSSSAPQEFTFTRPDVASTGSLSPDATTNVVMPTVAALPTIAALPSELIVPIAVQPGSGSRSLPVPKAAKMKPVKQIPTSLTFNNLVFPSTTAATTATSTTPSSLLRVPGSDIPIGNIGDMSSVPVWRQAGRKTARPAAERPVGVKSRVVVDMADADRLRSLVPGAFAVISNGRQVMQAGAFGDTTKANQLLSTLMSQGIRATVENF
jgi:parallel beta-helix repeat protein